MKLIWIHYIYMFKRLFLNKYIYKLKVSFKNNILVLNYKEIKKIKDAISKAILFIKIVFTI